MKVKFVVNGDPIEIEIVLDAPLRDAVQEVLTRSNNTGRPFADWELRDDMGRLLSVERSFAEHAWLSDNNYLFVTPFVGVGGSTYHLGRNLSL